MAITFKDEISGYGPYSLINYETSLVKVGEDLVPKEEEVKRTEAQTYRSRKSLLRDSVRTPSYSKKLKMGNLPVNRFESNLLETTFLVVDRTRRNERGSYPHYRTVESGYLPESNQFHRYLRAYSSFAGTTEERSASKEAEARALADIKSQKINVAQFFAERKQTISLIADSAAKIAGFLRALKRGDIISAGKALGSRPSRRIRRNYRELQSQSPRDATADAWLAMQYGWKPLLSDIHGAVEMLVERTSDIQRCMAKSRAHRTFESSVTFTDAFGEWTFKTSGRVVVKYTYMFDVKQGTNDMQRLGLTNPLQVAWELVPYSFVVDWFLPIGNFLASLDATIGISFSTGAKVIFSKGTTTAVWTPTPEPERRYFSEGGGSGRHEFTHTVRTVQSGFPTPRLPSFKNPFSVEHALNALALISGAVSRRR